MRPTKESRRSRNPKMNWKSDEYLGSHPNSHDWARLAAYIDGEGSINLTPRRTNTGKTITFCAKVVVTNTDFRLAKWCLDTFGMKFYEHSNNALPISRNQNWSACVYAQACGYKASWILRNCLPWFLLKRSQAEVVLEHQESIGPDVWARGSGVTTPQNILDYRMELKRKLAELNRRGPKPELTEKVMEA